MENYKTDGERLANETLQLCKQTFTLMEWEIGVQDGLSFTLWGMNTNGARGLLSVQNGCVAIFEIYNLDGVVQEKYYANNPSKQEQKPIKTAIDETAEEISNKSPRLSRLIGLASSLVTTDSTLALCTKYFPLLEWSIKARGRNGDETTHLIQGIGGSARVEMTVFQSNAQCRLYINKTSCCAHSADDNLSPEEALKQVRHQWENIEKPLRLLG